MIKLCIPLLLFVVFLSLVPSFMWAQARQSINGIIIGNVLDGETGKAIPTATVILRGMRDSVVARSIVTDKNGGFELDKIPFGLYRVQFSAIGFAGLAIDSLNLRAERFDFNLGDIKLFKKANDLDEVVVYAEKPLIESREGKITFNVGESALSAGSSTTELLKNMPLISNDANGKLLLKGKEPKILIDDKPTELTAQQLNDLLESLPGSSIEKIELMTNPPPQYASESGGVINIVTKKGKVGLTGRVTISYGTRGEGNLAANVSYRNKKFAVNATIGAGASRLNGGSHSYRTNFYSDSTNFFATSSKFLNKSVRPNARISADYEIDKYRSFNATVQFNGNYFDNESNTFYTNINKGNTAYKITSRQNQSDGNNINPTASVTYSAKGKDPRELFRVIASYGFGNTDNTRNYYQRFLDGAYNPTSMDSLQRQATDNISHNYGLRVDYNRPFKELKSLLSTGVFINQNDYHNILNTSFLRRSDTQYVKNEGLSNDFDFLQTIAAARAAITVDLPKQWRITTGAQLEYTKFAFDFRKGMAADDDNNYWNLLPNFTLRKDWNREWNASIVYRRSIRRPGIGELNPSIENNDPFNLRFGNPSLLPQLADNFDFNLGAYKGKLYANFSVGYNHVTDIIQSIRTLISEGKTQTTYNNITDRKEYEASVWGGYSFSKQLRLNISAGYTFNEYSLYDRTVNRYRNGGTFYTNLNYNFILNDRISFDGNLRYNAIADAQGRSRSNLTQNIGAQTKFFNKRLTLSINLIDLFAQQQFNTYIYGPNYNLQSTSNSNTRNVRLSLSYNLNKNKAKISAKQQKAILKGLKTD